MKATLALLIALTTACHAADQFEGWRNYTFNTYMTNSAPRSNTIVTSLYATIFVNTATNVIEGNNSEGCNLCYDKNGNWLGAIPAVMNAEPCKPYRPPTERWVITNVVESTTITFDWAGKSYVQTSDKTLSSTTNRWKLAQEWRKE